MIGQRIGKYRVLDRLGSGGMGVVYGAEDERLKRKVAIKLLPPTMASDSEARSRLEREAQSISALDHPNICTIHEIGEHEGQLFIVMACYEGQTLRQVLDRGPLPPGQAAFIGSQIARGLERAHEAGIVHRDVKPANVMITPRSEVKLLDFGLAKSRDAMNLTAQGALAGTPAYMSPEQVEGHPVDHRADVWALGVIAYEMFSGEPPFRGDSMAALMRSILHDEPEPLSKRCPSVPRNIEQAVQRALDKDPRTRAADVGLLRVAMEGPQEALNAATLAPPAAPTAAPSRGQASSVDGAAEGSAARLKSVAVLPFANRSPDPEQAYFCEGLTDELITGLTRLNRFRVASRSAAMRPRERSDAASVGRELRVDAVLEGSVRRAGQQLRVSVQLVDVATGFVTWSDRYDRDLQDVFRIQEEITERVVQGLSGVFGPEDRARLIAGTTQTLEAYEYYLRGRTLARQGRRLPLEEAIRMYERAIEIDPNYALAYAGIASARTWLYSQWGGDAAHAREAHRAASKAVELAPNLAEAHAALATCLSLDSEREAAQRAFEEAMRINSNSPWVLQAYADHWFRNGEIERAAEYYKKALALDPERYEVRGTPLALILKRLGRHDEFVAYVRKNFELSAREAAVNPGDARAVYLAGFSLLRLGETQKGMEWIERALAIDPEDLLVLYNVACAFSIAGETERALAALEKTVANGFGNLAWLENDSDFDSIRDHPRFAAIVDRLRRACVLGAPRPMSYRTPGPSGDAPNPLDYRAPAPADDTETIRNLYMPLGFLVAGLVIELLAAYLRSRTPADAAVDVTLTLVVRTVLLVVAVLIAARFRQIDLGRLQTAVLKLTAVVVGAAAVVTLLSPVLAALPHVPTMFDSAIPLGWLLGLAVYFGTQFLLVGVLFDLDESDTRYCVMVMFIVWVAAYFGLAALATYV